MDIKGLLFFFYGRIKSFILLCIDHSLNFGKRLFHFLKSFSFFFYFYPDQLSLLSEIANIAR